MHWYIFPVILYWGSRKSYNKHTSEAANILNIFRKKEGHGLKPSDPGGLRKYQGHIIRNDKILRAGFIFLDATGSLGKLK